MRAFGREIGLAFQIVDDLIDLSGNEEAAGKSIGTDVEDGKVTFKVLHAYQNADAATRAHARRVHAARPRRGARGPSRAPARGL